MDEASKPIIKGDLRALIRISVPLMLFLFCEALTLFCERIFLSYHYQEMMYLAEREIDLASRRSYYLQAEKLLLDEMPVMPAFLVEAPALKKKNFHIGCSSPLINFKWGYFT